MSRYPARDTYRNGHAVTIWPASTTYTTIRPVVLGLAKLAFLPLVSAAPTLLPSFAARSAGEHKHSNDGMEAGDPDLWLYLGFAMVLVLSGGAFAGLTIALMGQDETYLQVIATSGEGAERKHARKVLDLLGKGKHWVLVTLLLSNVITNETLPIVLDRSLGGGWPAVVGSTVLIVIFGEIVPQSICVRYGLSIGAYMAPFVLLLMWSLCIVAWPTAKLLDYMLGEDHGTTYNKPGLKTLVQLHKTLGHAPSDRLMEDEVTIISSVLDLKEKSVGSIMTPMNDVFTMSADTVLDEKMMDTVLSQGYSRIPIHAPDNPRNFIGMLLVKILITYDPEDAKRVRDFALATLPETRHETSCLDIINFFQEGKSHMVLVSDFPGQDKGALGVVTLEDVIEELIGEEIIDESDVFVDVHKAIRRVAPAPHTRYKKPMTEAEVEVKEASETAPLLGKKQSKDALSQGVPPNGAATFLMRRKSSNASDPAGRQIARPVSIRGPNELRGSELRQHLGHLGPSNQASKPRATKYTSVKIKPGVTTIPEGQATSESGRLRSQSLEITHAGPDGGEGVGLLRNAGLDARDGVVAVAGYGSIAEGSPRPASARGMTDPQSPSHLSAREASELARENTNVPEDSESPTNSHGGTFPSRMTGDKLVVGHLDEDDEDDGDQLGELRETASRDRSDTRRTTRSGSITETTVDVNGMQKVVLETTSSSEEVDQESDTKETKESLQSEASGSGSKSKKKRKPKRGKGSSS